MGLGISANADGSFVVTGYFNGTAIFGALETNETMLTSDGEEEMFVARYGADGGF